MQNENVEKNVEKKTDKKATKSKVLESKRMSKYNNSTFLHYFLIEILKLGR